MSREHDMNAIRKPSTTCHTFANYTLGTWKAAYNHLKQRADKISEKKKLRVLGLNRSRAQDAGPSHQSRRLMTSSIWQGQIKLDVEFRKYANFVKKWLCLSSKWILVEYCPQRSGWSGGVICFEPSSLFGFDIFMFLPSLYDTQTIIDGAIR